MTTSFKQIFDKIDNKLSNVKSLNLTTADGFTIFCETGNNFSIEKDKLSAVTSSLTALSNAAAKQLIGSSFSSTFIETDKGLMCMVKTNYKGKSCILSLISGEDPNLGQIRYFLKILARELETASLSADNR